MEKKMIVTVNLKGLSEKDFIAKGKSMVKAQIDNPTYVPGLTPAASAVESKFDALDALIATRASLRLLLKENTLSLKASRTEISDILTDDWANQTQKACAGSPDKVVALGFGIKGEEDGKAEPIATIKNSKPDILDIDLNHEMQHTLSIINTVSKKIALPGDAKRMDIYISYGETEPASLKDMDFVGSSDRGKFIMEFTPEQKGQTVWYTAIYIGKKKGLKGETASKVRALVV